ncbi:MAG: aromatic acid exporter family protein [Roseburia sp.]|nr:aromatic acid exporter family protein [Roseburia sp.]
MLKLIKIAAGSVAAILIADRLGLSYSASAGIITLLTIQDTAKETIAISAKRAAAFLVATALAYAVFYFGGYNAFSYGVFLLLFIACCRPLGLSAAVSTNAVLVTHYLAQREMSLAWIGNEALLLLVGAGIGTLLNLYIPGKRREIRATQCVLEEDLRTVLLRMSEYLKKEDKSDYTGSCFDKLSADLAEGKRQAFAYMNNTFFQESKYFIEYMSMREQQCMVLREIYKKIRALSAVPVQAEKISSFVCAISVSFAETNNARALLDSLAKLSAQLKESALPATREEFENRAVLYSILVDLEYFLQLKKDFADARTAEEIRRYWEE